MFSDYGDILMDKRLSSDSDESGRFQRADSFRKVLPSKPSASVDSRLSMSMRRVVPATTASDADRGARAYAPYILEYVMLNEYQLFQKKEIPGLYVVPADKNPLIWYGVLFIHEGIYHRGIFRFQVRFPEHFPDSDCPRIVFDENFFHPAVSLETGDLNVAAEFREWRKSVNNVWQLLQYTKSVFFKLDTVAPLNEAAAKMLLEDPDSFRIEAEKCVEDSLSKLYLPPSDDDINYITFQPYDDVIHGSLRQQVISEK